MPAGDVDLGDFDVLTFDCYGTLIDWEAGILEALREARPEGWPMPGEALLERFAFHEAAAESGTYLSYRDVLAQAIQGIARDGGVKVTAGAVRRFASSVANWPPFSDSARALRRLAARYRLGVITNCDEDLFAASRARLGVNFDWVITAERVRSYKPSRRNFEAALAEIDAPRDRILHVAQSLYHDHVPAQDLGLFTVWIDRRRGRAGHGATPPADAVPDLVFPSLKALADAADGRATNGA
jgi:2-haloacid dehalogenase